MIQLAKKISWGRTIKTPGFVGRTSQRPNCGPGKNVGMLQKRWNAWKIPFCAGFCFVAWLPVVVIAVACSIVGTKILHKIYWKGPTGKVSGLAWIHGTLCVCGHHPAVWSVPVKYGPHSGLFFFLMKEPVALTKAVPSKPFVSAETLKARALIVLHLVAAEDAAGSSGSHSPDLGDM